MSGLFQQLVFQLGAKQCLVPRITRCTCKVPFNFEEYDYEKDWDEGISLLLFAVRESVQKSLGFSPFEFVFVIQSMVLSSC